MNSFFSFFKSWFDQFIHTISSLLDKFEDVAANGYFIWKIPSGSLISQEIGIHESLFKQIQFSVTDLIQPRFLSVSRTIRIYIYLYNTQIYRKEVCERKLRLKKDKIFIPCVFSIFVSTYKFNFFLSKMICIMRRFNRNFDQTIVPLCSNREFGNSAINLILIVEMVERFFKKKKKLCNIFAI